MTYDGFTFFNELDLLEIRLNELAGVVDRFILVEATTTFNGDPKPLHYAENKARFAPFNDKIIHIVVDDFAAADNGRTFDERAWMRECLQRNAIARGLANAKPDDLVIVSDLDEIPRADAVRQAIIDYPQGGGAVFSFSLRAYNFCLNLRDASVPVWGNDPKMADVRTFNAPATYADVPYTHFCPEAVCRGETATRFRFVKPDHRYPDAGWHFSYLGDTAAVMRKIKARNEWGLHTMEDAALQRHIQTCLASGKAPFGFHRFLPEPFDATFPAFVRAHRERFAPLIADVTPEEYARARFLRTWYYARGRVRRAVYAFLFTLTPTWVRALIKKILGLRF